MDLYAQVSGATVASYVWGYSGAPDLNTSTISGQGTYHFHFQWNDITSPPSGPDTITLQSNNIDHTFQFETFHFALYWDSSSDRAWVPDSSRPTRAPTLPLLVPPDAVKPDQATIDAQYYSLGEQTGEVMTQFTLPSYHPAVAPLQLDYSSLAANPRPIFTDYYQLSQQPGTGSTVTATLKLNGATQGTSNYDMHLLNQGDILAIALQGDATGLSTGRYPDEIDVTENSTVQPAQTGYVNIVNSAQSPFGAGWTLANLKHAWPASDGSGVMVETADGQSFWYKSLGGGNYQSQPGDTATLSFNGYGYERDLKDGTKYMFYGDNGTVEWLYNSVENRRTDFNYNPADLSQLISITDFLGNTVTLAYNGAGKVSGFQDPVGRTTQLGYDASNTQLTSITDPNPSIPGFTEAIPVMTYGYDAANKLTKLIDPDGNPTTFAYSSLSGRISTVMWADGTTESLTPQQVTGLVASGDETATLAVQAGAGYTDPRGKAWFDTLDWSGFGHDTENFDPKGDETVIHRDTNGFPWLFEDPLDNATRTFFDQGSSLVQGNPTEIVLPDGTYEQNTYTSDSLPVSQTDANGHTVTYGYGPFAGCLCAKSKTLPPVGSPPQTPTYGYSWSDDDFLQGATDPSGDHWNYYYDGAARMNYLTEPNDSGTPSTNPTVTFGYNSENYLTWTEDELSHFTTYTVDKLGRVLAVQLPTGGVVTMTYDAAGNQTSITDPTPLASGTDITQFQYDAMNRVHSETDPNGLTITYDYDAAGNLQDIFERDTLPSGNHQDRHFIYDDAGRLINEQWLDGSTVDYTATYGYDVASEMTSASDNNSAYVMAYDSRGREISVDSANTLNIPHVVLTFVYDAVGNRTEVMDNLNPSGTITFAYDADNRLTGLTMNVTGASDHPVVTLQYDSDARLTNIYRSTSSTGNQVNTVLGYTHRNLVQSITDTSSTGNGTLAAYTYGYDVARNLQTKSDYDNVTNATVTFAYSYDGLNQLTGATASNSSYDESYSYTNAQNQDLNGNRSSASFGSTNQTYGAPAPDNRLTSDGQYNYTYGNQGNLVNKTGMEGGVTYSYDYSYDFRNRLTEAKKTQVSNGRVVADDQFTYDMFDRRIGKLTQGGTQQWTVYDGGNAYADFSGQTLTTRYVFANGLDGILARTNASGNSTAWYLTDNIGSVRQIVDANGNDLYHVNYFTFGGIIPGSESGSGGDRFKFAGREWDSEIGLYYNRARYYDPNTGRFISEDPIGFGAGDPNLYRYAHNGPTVRTDPSGLLSVQVAALNPEFAWVFAENGIIIGGAAAAGAAVKAATVTVGGYAIYKVCAAIIAADAPNPEQSDAIAKDIQKEIDAWQTKKETAEAGGRWGDADHADTQIQMLENEIRKLFGLPPKPWLGG